MNINEQTVSCNRHVSRKLLITTFNMCLQAVIFINDGQKLDLIYFVIHQV